LSNTGSSSCFLQGYLGLSVPIEGGKFVAVSVIHAGRIDATGLQTARPDVQPVAVLLGPANTGNAWIGMKWSNWCGAAPQGMKVLIPPHSLLEINASDTNWQATTCVSSSSRFVLNEGPVQTPAS
jgi:hypothetical protein